jgi:hypothetical protein
MPEYPEKRADRKHKDPKTCSYCSGRGEDRRMERREEVTIHIDIGPDGQHVAPRP